VLDNVSVVENNFRCVYVNRINIFVLIFLSGEYTHISTKADVQENVQVCYVCLLLFVFLLNSWPGALEGT
jgi:hypothetical protein